MSSTDCNAALPHNDADSQAAVLTQPSSNLVGRGFESKELAESACGTSAQLICSNGTRPCAKQNREYEENFLFPNAAICSKRQNKDGN